MRLIGAAGQATVRPDALTVVVRLTEPAKLNVLVSITIVDAPEPALKLTGLVAVIVKSPTWTVILVEFVVDPLVPVTVTK